MWHRNFLRRHKEIPVRITSANCREKAQAWTDEKSPSWTATLEGVANDGFLSDADGIINIDKSGFKTEEVYDKVYGTQETKEVPSLYNEADREQITVLFGGFACSRMLRPQVIYDSKMQLQSRFEGTSH